MRVKALQDQCAAKEGVVTWDRKHNTNLLDQQKQYKDGLHDLNHELKTKVEKLEEAECQKQKLQEEVMALCEKVETARIDAVQKFKASQSFIDSCADYYGTRFDDCLKQVASAFPKLDLSEITMDNPEPTMLVGDVVVDEGDGSLKSNLPPKDDGVVVLAQPAANPPPASTSNPQVVSVDVENPQSQKGDGNFTDAFAT